MKKTTVELEEGGVVLGKEEAQWVRKALVLGLTCYGEIEIAINAAALGEHDGAKLPAGVKPRHPTGSSDVAADFASALSVML